jgi:hypothetical protein
MALTCRWRSRPQHQERSVVGFINGGSDGNGCSFYLFETGEQIERGFYFFIVS